jgi:hypothetical protein
MHGGPDLSALSDGPYRTSILVLAATSPPRARKLSILVMATVLRYWYLPPPRVAARPSAMAGPPYKLLNTYHKKSLIILMITYNKL